MTNPGPPERVDATPPEAPGHLGRLNPATTVVAAGRPPRIPGASVNVPVELTSTYAAPETGVAYGRNGNRVWTAFEDALGQLEGGEALVYASGMAAISAVMSLVPAGGVVVAPRHAYNLTTAIHAEYATLGYEVRQADISDTGAFVEAMDGADLVWTESPTNPMLEVADLPTLFAEARRCGALVVCDNTLATPLLQRPLELGADVVVHAVTKYLSGHTDVVLGAVVTGREGNGPKLRERLTWHRTLHGGIAGPMEVWLALRGLRTLDVRLERACANAAEIARRAASHPAVERVRYPGFGAMVSVEVRGGAVAADATAAGCRLWLDATSLGGVESLIERRRKYPAESPTVPENLLRLSVGIEHVDDLWHDLDQSLRAAHPRT